LEILPAFQNNLGCPVGILKPSIALVAPASNRETDDEAVLEGSAELAAVTVIVAGEGTAAGAVYSPAELIVPQAVELQPEPCTVHVTAVFEVPTTAAVNV
jgi:hypothetical protein